MIALLLALLCTSPTPQRAWQDEVLCWDSGHCGPRVVNLGAWDPIPPGYIPVQYTGPAPEVSR